MTFRTSADSPQHPSTLTVGLRALIALGPALLGLMLAILLPVFWADRLPDPVASHFSLTGKPDGWMSLAASTTVSAGIFLLLLALATLGLVGRFFLGTAGRISVGVETGVATLLLIVTTAALWGQLDGQPAHLGLGVILLALGAALAVGTMCGLLFPAGPAPENRPPAVAPVHIGPTEKVVWIRTQHAPIWAMAALGVAIIATCLLALISWSIGPAIATFALCLASMATFSFTVRIDDSGVHWRAALGLPRGHIPIDQIAQAEQIMVEPMAYGGWGIRGVSSRLGRLALILRRGEALKVTRTNGGVFVATVDDAVTGAAVLNGLIERERAAGRRAHT